MRPRAVISPRLNAPRSLPSLLLAAQVALDQWRGADSIMARLDAARPTIDVPEIAGIRDALQPADRVVCTDELGCLLLIGRIDRWLALDDFVRERFLVRRGDAPVSGVYTGVPGGVSSRRSVRAERRMGPFPTAS